MVYRDGMRNRRKIEGRGMIVESYFCAMIHLFCLKYCCSSKYHYSFLFLDITIGVYSIKRHF